MTKSNMISKKNPHDMTAEEQQKYYLQKWERVKGSLGLYEDEYGVQMVNHNWYYFITNYSRVFSLAEWHGTPYREKSYCTKEAKNAKVIGDNSQLSVGLKLPNGKVPVFRVSNLVSEYFPVDTFNPAESQEKIECHHRHPYDTAKGLENNYPENLQLAPKSSVHAKIFTQLQKSNLIESGMKLTKNKKFIEALANLGKDAKQEFAIISEVDKETGNVQAVWGEQEIQPLLQDEVIRKFMQKVSDAYALELAEAKSAYLHKHWEQAIVGNGTLSFTGEIDTSCPEGKRLYELTGGNVE